MRSFTQNFFRNLFSRTPCRIAFTGTETLLGQDISSRTTEDVVRRVDETPSLDWKKLSRQSPNIVTLGCIHGKLSRTNVGDLQRVVFKLCVLTTRVTTLSQPGRCPGI